MEHAPRRAAPSDDLCKVTIGGKFHHNADLGAVNEGLLVVDDVWVVD
jgi:hypothetical protein